MKRMIALIAAVVSAMAFGGNVCTWSGASATSPNDWSDSDNWDVKPVGGNGDTIVIPSGKTACLDASISAARTIVENGFAEIKMVGRIGEAANPGKLVVMVGAEDSPLTLNGKILGYRYGASDANSDASSGLVVKKGVGALRLKATLGDKDLYTNFIVEQGDLYLPQDVSSSSYYHDVCISNGATLHVAAKAGTRYDNLISALTGEGTVTNSHANGYTDIQLHVGGTCEFGGKLTNIRLFSRGGRLALTGTNSTMTSAVTVRDNKGAGFDGGGMLSFARVGVKGEPSSIGTSDGFVFGTSGGVFIYTGTGETTDKALRWQYPKTQKTFLSGGPHGGLVFNSASSWNIAYVGSDSNLGMVSLALSVDNPTNACVMAGAIDSSVYPAGHTNRLYITKTGAGIWRFADHATRNGVGGIAVEEGTLQFDTLAEKGVMCALGTAEECHSDYYGEYDASKRVDYAFSAGSASAEGALEYTGSTPVWVTQRPMVLNGDVRFKNDGAAAFRYANVTPQTAGAKTVTLDGAGAGENVIADIFDSASAPVSIVKEGAGTWTLANTNAIHGAITVKGGTLKIASPSNRYTWFLWTLKEVLAPSEVSSCAVAEFCFYGKDEGYERVNAGMSIAADYASIQPGQAAFFSTKSIQGSLANLFNGNFGTDTGFQGATGGGAASANNEETHIPVLFRFGESTPEIGRYDFACRFGTQNAASYYGKNPKAWTLHGSVDGFHWDMIHEVVDATSAGSDMSPYSGNSRFYAAHSNRDEAMNAGTNAHVFASSRATSAANPLAEVASVSVVSNSTLEVVGEALEVGGIVADITSGGTFRNLSFAENGTLDISDKGSGVVELPISFENCTGVERIAGWSLSVAGEATTKRRISVSGGKVSIVPRGFVMVYR